MLHWSRLSFRAIINRLFDRILIDEINKDNCIEFDRIDEAFYREKQIQGWSHKKKKALIEGNIDELVTLSKSSSRQAR